MYIWNYPLLVFICILIAVCIVYGVMTLIFKIFTPKQDKQLAVLDAYIDSVAKCNDLRTVSLPSCNEKTYRKIEAKLAKEFSNFNRMISSIQGIEDIKCGNFCFFLAFPRKEPEFNGQRIYDSRYDDITKSWKLSISKTLCLMKEWPEAKLEILKIHKQNILEFNAEVAEISSLVQRNIT